MTTMMPDGRLTTLSDDERQPCEIFERVVGYFRPISSFNIGVRQMYEDRVRYSEEQILRGIDAEEKST